jgi:hypothetical protein
MIPLEYNSQVPQPKNEIAQGQTDFLANFSQLFNAFNIDHVSLTDPTNPGNHNVARLNQQDNALTTEVTEIALYSKLVADQTDQLFFRPQQNGDEIQYTNYQIYPLPQIMSGGILRQGQFFSFLPGNIIVYFGYVFPNASPFRLQLNPPIARNLFGINLCCFGATGLYPSVVSPIETTPGFFGALNLSQIQPLGAIPPNQYYIVYGSL